MNLPERFDLNYIASDGSKKRPIMLHRVIYGALERFIGVLIEHYAGAFPTWLAPVQVNVIPVSNEHHLEYAKEVVRETLRNNKIRVELDARDEKLGYRMRDSQMAKVPFTLVIGDKEQDTNSVNYRMYGKDDNISINLNEFISLLNDVIINKK
jgi:threonyl-tRNA synthetase